MASDYIVLVNNVLRDMNEVELTSSTFTSSRGVQTTVKDYINRAISDILNSELNWPFTHASGEVVHKLRLLRLQSATLTKCC